MLAAMASGERRELTICCNGWPCWGPLTVAIFPFCCKASCLICSNSNRSWSSNLLSNFRLSVQIPTLLSFVTQILQQLTMTEHPHSIVYRSGMALRQGFAMLQSWLPSFSSVKLPPSPVSLVAFVGVAFLHSPPRVDVQPLHLAAVLVSNCMFHDSAIAFECTGLVAHFCRRVLVAVVSELPNQNPCHVDWLPCLTVPQRSVAVAAVFDILVGVRMHV